MCAQRHALLVLVGLLFVPASLAGGLGGAQSRSAAPAPAEVETLVATPPPKIEALPLVLNGQPTVAPQPAMPESRRLTLEYPPNIRVGDSDVIRLTLEVDTLGNVTPTAEVGRNVVK